MPALAETLASLVSLFIAFVSRSAGRTDRSALREGASEALAPAPLDKALPRWAMSAFGGFR
jgi:hypothetical protein